MYVKRITKLATDIPSESSRFSATATASRQIVQKALDPRRKSGFNSRTITYTLLVMGVIARQCSPIYDFFNSQKINRPLYGSTTVVHSGVIPFANYPLLPLFWKVVMIDETFMSHEI